MKNTIKLLSIIPFLLISSKSIAQIDTLNYLKQFEINKAQFINQPFSHLLNHITQIQPKSHWAHSSMKNKYIVKASTFNFCQMDYSFKNAVTLRITWQDTFPKSGVKYLQNKNGYYFTNEEKIFYGDKIVKDIMVYR
ncbi:hypothetical protein [Chryseobacterium sp. Hurlbut01]|uniref:hypothetical protein n=1 Tax=Chryseobacterium sp. Hurlbut01 TaxID=1681828 RepID=UPI00067B3971|nr:hypothetical protein [Chryseobacterium sp. Hurlbut01]KNB63185.1 hypothetical protein AC804_00875 [Chryseobacterium sp. Hurlbut01]